MGKKSDLSPKCQKFVKKLFAFFSKEKATKKPIVSFDRVYQRTSKALGVSYTSVHRIMNDKRPCKSNRPKERAKMLDDFDHCVNSGQLSTKIYDKRDDFNFKIINFPNMCSNIPASPAYGVYISQLIRYARASSNYSDFLKRHLHLRNRLLDQGYKKIRLIRSLKKFIFRYQYLVEIYSVSAEKIISDAFSYSENV